MVNGHGLGSSYEVKDGSNDAPVFNSFDYPTFEDLSDLTLGDGTALLDVVAGGAFFSAPLRGSQACSYTDYEKNACVTNPEVSQPVVDGTELSFTVTDQIDTRRYVFSDPTQSSSTIEVIDPASNETVEVFITRTPNGTETVWHLSSNGISSTTVENSDCSGSHTSRQIVDGEILYSNDVSWTSTKSEQLSIDYTYCGEAVNACLRRTITTQ